MMFISTIIHTLEAVTGLLAVFLVYRVSRCYKAFYHPAVHTPLTQASLANAPLQKVISGVSNTEFVEGNVAAGDLAIGDVIDGASGSKPVAPATVGSETILVDYIGEFFGENPVADIQAYKATSVETTPAAEHTVETSVVKESIVEEILVVPDEFRAISDVMPDHADKPVVPDDPKSNLLVPVLVDQVMLDEAEDDTFIMVETEDKKASSANVMSDKVVHAMLDEAKLVCVS